MSVGGYITDLSLAGRSFSTAADAEVNIDYGGDSNEIEMNGDNTGRVVKEKVPWSMEGVVISIDNEKEDYEFLNQLRSRGRLFPITAGLADGTILQGDGQITGALALSSKNTTVPVTLKGTGRLSKQ